MPSHLWDVTQESVLISFIETMPDFWDHTTEMYPKKNHRTTLLLQLQTKLLHAFPVKCKDISMADIQKRWSSLRSYMQRLIGMENKNERAVISNWVHFEQMQFLYVLIKYGCRSSEVSSNSASLDPVEMKYCDSFLDISSSAAPGSSGEPTSTDSRRQDEDLVSNHNRAKRIKYQHLQEGVTPVANLQELLQVELESHHQDTNNSVLQDPVTLQQGEHFLAKVSADLVRGTINELKDDARIVFFNKITSICTETLKNQMNGT